MKKKQIKNLREKLLAGWTVLLLIFSVMVLTSAAKNGSNSETSQQSGTTVTSAFSSLTEITKMETIAETTTTEPEVVRTTEPDISDSDVELLAIAIYKEAGADDISDETRFMVGDVILNRVDSEYFPNTIYDVLMQPGQYNTFSWEGIHWPEQDYSRANHNAIDRAMDISRRLLSGEHSELYGRGYIWQAEFEQGTDIIYRDGIYFGR